MPLNGSGGVTQPSGSLYPAVPSTLIQSAKANASIADIYTILASAIYKDGQQTATQRVPFAAGISTDTVTEKTAATGVTLDSVLLKDGRIDTTQGADIVCAATIDLETATGNVADVTGSTGPVTAITLSQGHWRIVRFTGTPTLTHGASLVLPGAADIVAAAGDYALFIGYAAGVVRVWYMRASGAAVITAPFSDGTALVKGSADATKLVRFEVDGLTTATTRVLTVPNFDGTIATLAGTETLTNKTLTNPSIDTVIGAVVATQANMETATATNLVVSPGRQQFHPSAAKAWCQWNTAGTINASYNVTSVTDSAVGDQLVNLTVAFSSASYTAISSTRGDWTSGNSATVIVSACPNTTASASVIRVVTARVSDGAFTDPAASFHVVAYGDQ